MHSLRSKFLQCNLWSCENHLTGAYFVVADNQTQEKLLKNESRKTSNMEQCAVTLFVISCKSVFTKSESASFLETEHWDNDV
jgi:hypothetical protein